MMEVKTLNVCNLLSSSSSSSVWPGSSVLSSRLARSLLNEITSFFRAAYTPV